MNAAVTFGAFFAGAIAVCLVGIGLGQGIIVMVPCSRATYHFQS